MTTPASETYSEYMLRMSDDGAGGLADQSTIQANIAASFEDIGIVISDLGDLPADASIRLNGLFSDAHAAKEYLLDGGLVGGDDSGNTAPLGYSFFYRYFSDLYQDYVYLVYVRDTSE